MQIIDKFLPLDLLKKVIHKKNVFAKERHFGVTNLSWTKNLQTNSSLIFIMPFPEIEDEIREVLIKELNDNKLKDLNIFTQMCVFSRGSCIPLHSDKDYYLGATVYLNKRWSSENGGLFLFESDSYLNVVVPKYNRCVINYKHNYHMVSQVSSNIEEPRITIQIFVTNEFKQQPLVVKHPLIVNYS